MLLILVGYSNILQFILHKFREIFMRSHMQTLFYVNNIFIYIFIHKQFTIFIISLHKGDN